MYVPPPPLTDADRCPHCGARAAVSPSAALRWVCGACGGARVLGLGGRPDPRTVTALVSARQARASAFGWRAGAVVLGLAAGMAATLAALVGLASHVAALVVAGIAALLALVAFGARGRGSRAARESKSLLDDAYVAAAETIARERDSALTAGALAQAMQIDRAAAEAILTRLSVAGRARVDVGDDADLRYRIDAEPPSTDASPPGDEPRDASPVSPLRDTQGPR